jgi:hypothetical protein
MTGPDLALDRCASAAMAALGRAGRTRADDLALYLAHVEGAAPLRRLAALSGRAPSSVHRAVRRVEASRDDPLMDVVVDAAGAAARAGSGVAAPLWDGPDDRETGSEELVRRVARRTLERLAEAGAFMMVADGAERAGVFSPRNRFRRPLGLLTVGHAAELAARGWVRCASRTASSARYVIDAPGRAWLRAAVGEPPRPPAAPTAPRAVESPVAWLARRRGPDGAAFLAPEEVEAGERLRDDWDAARIPSGDDWRAALAAADFAGAAAARERLVRAVADLGPGLADAAVRVCCLSEGIEAVERRMGWAARSGKVVLKIALQRLSGHAEWTSAPPSRAA